MTNTISQSAIGDFLTCRYLYFLKHRQGLAPAAEDAGVANERQTALRRGQQFHRAAQQYLSGLDSDIVQAGLKDEMVKAWFVRLVESGVSGVPRNRCVETWSAVTLGDCVLVARFDLLAWDDERLVVFDWKTGSRPARDLAGDVQTVVYRYIAARSALKLTGKAYAPEQIELCYWYVRDPVSAVKIAYSHKEFERDETQLLTWIEEIVTCSDFAKTTHVEVCQTCVFRSVCRPSVKPVNDTPEYDHAGELDPVGWGDA